MIASEDIKKFDSALTQSNTSEVEKYLQQDAQYADIELSTAGHRPLHRATADTNQYSSQYNVSTILAKGADPDSHTTDGYTPLWNATNIGNSKTATLIIDALKKKYAGSPEKLVAALRAKPKNSNKSPEQCALDNAESALRNRISQEISKALVALGDKPHFEKALLNGNTTLVDEFLYANTVDVNGELTTQGQRPLHLATADNNQASSTYNVNSLLAKEANPDSRALDGSSPLWNAANAGNSKTGIALIETLKKKYAKSPQELLEALRAKPKSSNQSPEQRAQDNYENTLKSRINQEISKTLVVLGDKGHFERALINGNTTLTDEFLSAGTVETNAELTSEKHRPLHRATADNNQGTSTYNVTSLLNKGADPDARTADGGTPLWNAANAGNAKTGILIIDALKKKYTGSPDKLLEALRAKPKNSNKSPEQCAQDNYENTLKSRINQEISKALVALGDKGHFDRALTNGNTGLVDEFLSAGTVDVNTELTSEKHQPLHRATADTNQSSSTFNVTALLNKGADPDARTSDGTTPLWNTANVGNGKTGILIIDALKKKHTGSPDKLLEALRAKPRNSNKSPEQCAQDNFENTLKSRINQEISKALVALGDKGHFEKALASGNTTLVDDFLNAGTVDVNAELNTEKHRPLHKATADNNQSSSTFNVTSLLNKGADPDARANDGGTPLWNAANIGNEKAGILIIDALKKKYASSPDKLLDALQAKPRNSNKSPERCAQDGFEHNLKIRLQQEISALQGQGATAPTSPIPSNTVTQAVLDPVIPRSNAAAPIALDNTLTASTLMQIKEVGKSNLQVLGEQGQLMDVFDPEIWQGRRKDMDEAWEKVPEHFRNQVNIETIRGKLSKATLTERFKIDKDTGWEQGF